MVGLKGFAFAILKNKAGEGCSLEGAEVGFKVLYREKS